MKTTSMFKVALMAGAFATAGVFAQEGAGRPQQPPPRPAAGCPGQVRMQRPAGQPGEMIARELGLSQEQKAKIQEILKAHREEIGTAMKAAGELHKKFQAAVEAGDEAGARAAAAEIGKAMADGAAKRIAVKKEIEAVLTPEQKAKGEELRKAHQAKMEKVREAAKGRIQERLQNRRGGQGGPDGAGKDGGCCPPAAGNGEGMNNPPPMEEEEGMGNPPPAEEESEE